jgi:hypothetical protein
MLLFIVQKMQRTPFCLILLVGLNQEVINRGGMKCFSQIDEGGGEYG